MKYLTAGEILAAKDRKTIDVDVPEWGGTVKLQELSADDREWYYMQVTPPSGATPDKVNIVGIRAKLLSRCIVDENCNPIFDDGEVKMLGAKGNGSIDRVFAAAQKLSGMAPDAVDDAEKNSGAAPTSDSSTASP